jgi:hypothetical protein
MFDAIRVIYFKCHHIFLICQIKHPITFTKFRRRI